MTTIAWDGTTLAADRQSNFNGTPTRTTKVYAVHRAGRRWLFACAGSSGKAKTFLQLARGEVEKADLAELEILCVDDRGHLWFAENGLDWYPMRERRWAIGSGREFALGAMHAGATAVEAVRIASKLNLHTGLGVDWVRF